MRVLVAGLLFAVAGCATAQIDGVRAYGKISEVTPADIHSAISVARHDGSDHLKYPVYEIQVVSRDEIHVFRERRGHGVDFYDLMVRGNRGWAYGRTVIEGIE